MKRPAAAHWTSVKRCCGRPIMRQILVCKKRTFKGQQSKILGVARCRAVFQMDPCLRWGGGAVCAAGRHTSWWAAPLAPKPEARKGPPDLHPRRRHPITRCDHKGWGPFHYLNIGEIDPAPLCGPERVLAHLDVRLEVEDQWVLTPIYYYHLRKGEIIHLQNIDPKFRPGTSARRSSMK